MALEFLSSAWDKVLYIGGLGFLNLGPDGAVVAFTRILIGILIFTVLFAVAHGLGKSGKALGFLNKTQAMVVAAVLAIMSAVFLPAEVLLATGAGWATMIALILIGLPIVGVAYLLWQIPWEGEETKFTVFLKLVLCLVLLWILTAMKYHLEMLK